MLQRLLDAYPVLWLLIRRDFRARYAGSMLGVLWNVIHPLFLIGVYMLVFSRVMGTQRGGHGDYAVHLCSGIVPWFFFAEVVSRSTNALVENAGLLRKLALPEEVIYLSVFFNSLAVHTVGLAGLGAMLALTHGGLTWRVFLAFPAMWVLGLAGMGLGMLLSVVNLLLRDVGQLVSIALQLGFWLTPIAYYREVLPPRLERWLSANPAVPFISLIQDLFGSSGASFRTDSLAMIVVVPLLALLAGRAFLRRHRGEILDEL